MFVHLGYGIGSFCVPIISSPFLAETESMHSAVNETLDNNTTTGNETLLFVDKVSENTKIHNVLHRDSKIEYAYGISACFAALVSIAFYFCQVRESDCKVNGTIDGNQTRTDNLSKNIDNRSIKDIVNPATCANGRICYGSSIVFLVVIYLGNNAGADKMIGNFIRSFAIDQYGIGADLASALNTAYWITFSVGRFVFIFLARCIPIRVLIIIQTFGMAVSAGLLFLFAQNCSTLFWIFIQFLSFFGSAVLPTAIAWTEYHIKLTGLVMMMQIFGMSVGGICHMRLIGYLYGHLGPKSFIYQILGYGVLQFILAVGINSVGAIHGKRLADSSELKIEVKTIAKTVTHPNLKRDQTIELT
jgi:fucose permease